MGPHSFPPDLIPCFCVRVLIENKPTYVSYVRSNNQIGMDLALEWTYMLASALEANGCSIDLYEGPSAAMDGEDVLMET